MEWIVKIEGKENKAKQIRIVFEPIIEKINFFGEYKFNGQPHIFSHVIHDDIEITLEKIQEIMFTVVNDMNKRVEQHENLDKGFSVLKWVAFEEDDN